MAWLQSPPVFATFVLLHGAWSGAHGFHHVRRRLRVAGHEAFTPSLTDLGERVHLTGPGVGLSTHVSDIVNHVLYEDPVAPGGRQTPG
jgi:hypothetical protein